MSEAVTVKALYFGSSLFLGGIWSGNTNTSSLISRIFLSAGLLVGIVSSLALLFSSDSCSLSG